MISATAEDVFVEIIRGKSNAIPGIKLFGFILESTFTFIPNTFRIHSGRLFAIIPESRSGSPGFPFAMTGLVLARP
jgi:hypothetical protein